MGKAGEWRERERKQGKSNQGGNRKNPRGFVSSPHLKENIFSRHYQNKVNKYLSTFMNQKRLKQMQAESQLRQQLPPISDLVQDREEGETEFPIGGSTLKQEGSEQNIYEGIDMDAHHGEEAGNSQGERGSASLFEDIQSTLAFKQWKEQLREDEKESIHKWLKEKAKKEGYRIHLDNNFVITEMQDTGIKRKRHPSSPHSPDFPDSPDVPHAPPPLEESNPPHPQGYR